MKRTGLVVILSTGLSGCDNIFYHDNDPECRKFMAYQVEAKVIDHLEFEFKDGLYGAETLFRFCRKKGVDAAKERWENILALKGTQPCP